MKVVSRDVFELLSEARRMIEERDRIIAQQTRLLEYKAQALDMANGAIRELSDELDRLELAS